VYSSEDKSAACDKSAFVLWPEIVGCVLPRTTFMSSGKFFRCNNSAMHRSAMVRMARSEFVIKVTCYLRQRLGGKRGELQHLMYRPC
jgi:hypothetical protein